MKRTLQAKIAHSSSGKASADSTIALLSLGAAAQIAHHEKVHGEICLSVVENLRRKKWFQESSGKMNVNLLKVRTASNLFDIQMHISVGGCSFSSVSRFQELN